jgi:hypothetical protein
LLNGFHGAVNACRVHEDVYRAEFIARRLNYLFAAGFYSHVRRDSRCSPPAILDFGRDAPNLDFASGGYHHSSALLRESQRYTPADASAAAGYDRHSIS